MHEFTLCMAAMLYLLLVAGMQALAVIRYGTEGTDTQLRSLTSTQPHLSEHLLLPENNEYFQPPVYMLKEACRGI